MNNVGDNELPYTAGFVDTGGLAMQGIAAGYQHTCAVTPDGSVMCWGNNGVGQLGLGHTNNIGDNELPYTAGFAVLGAVFVKLLSSSAGSSSTCAFTGDNSVMCWGYNNNGQLGYGHINNIGDDEYPSAAGFVNAGVTFISIRVGGLHVCGLYGTVGVK
jgi:alpha-tubulin suppressor-like RCC1 family protein